MIDVFARSVFDGEREAELVSRFLGECPGTFVEVGANDPEIDSQTWHLERRGWDGILIEPLHECAERLRTMRRARVFGVAAGAPEADGKELPLLAAGALSTLGDYIVQGVKPREVRHVPVRSLDSILAESGIDRVDFLSIDVEGQELAVLRGLSLGRYRPRLILIEDDVHDLAKHSYLKARGYKLVRRTALNNWYVPQDTPFPVSLFGRWQLVRKLYLGMGLRRLKRRRRLRRGRGSPGRAKEVGRE